MDGKNNVRRRKTPLTMPEVSGDSLLDGLDLQQQEVATALRGPVRVMAGAGTGKTRAITHRIAYGIKNGVYRETNLLAVTFTAKAAAEMRSRLRGLGILNAQVHTFHAAALRQLRYFWAEAVGGEMPKLLDYKASTLVAAAKSIGIDVSKATIRDIATHIEWAKVSMLTPESYLNAVRRGDGRNLPQELDAGTIAKIYAAYEDTKIDYKVLDFEDVLLLMIGILEDNEGVAAYIRRQYQFFVVDEYQDISPVQERLLSLWLGGRDEICVVGDASQTIYSFAGASARFLVKFTEKYPNAQKIDLIRDYRSSPEIVATANHILQGRSSAAERFRLQAKKIYLEDKARLEAEAKEADELWFEPLQLVSQLPSQQKVLLNVYETENDEAAATAYSIANEIAAGQQARDIAILFRINSQSEAYEQALGQLGISYQMRGGERFFSRKEVVAAMGQIRSAARSGAGPDAAQTRSEAENSTRLWVRDLLISLGYAEQPPAGGGAVRERWESLNALVSMVDAMSVERAQRGEILTLADVAVELEKRVEGQHAPQVESVTLASLHSAKGLEWKSVYIVGLTEGLLPISYASTECDVDEERRLFYVGVTRARQYLHLSWARKKHEAAKQTVKASRFIQDIDRLDVVEVNYHKQETTVSFNDRSKNSSLSSRKKVIRVITCTVCGKELENRQERRRRRCLACSPCYDEELLAALKAWRSRKADQLSMPAFVVLIDSTLEYLAEHKPVRDEDLVRVPGIAQAKYKKFGKEIQEIIARHR